MGFALISFIQNHWPFALRKLDELELSNRLVNHLSIPEHTKRFVFATVDPESQAVVYILAAQNLSKQSALDAELLIKEVRPDVVVTQVAPSSLTEIQTEEKYIKRNCDFDDDSGPRNYFPTSWLGVLRGCFHDKIDKEKYESLAGSVLLKEVFGVGLHGHFFAAKKAAREVGSSVLLVESPFISCYADGPDSSGEPNQGKKNFQALSLNSSSLVAQNVGTGISSKRVISVSNLPSETMESLVSVLSQKPNISNSLSEARVGECGLKHDYHVPSFARTVYPLLCDLHDVFGNLPCVEMSLAHAQRMLHNIDKGETVDIQLLSEVQTFQVAVEGLRIGLNSAGRRPIKKAEKSKFSEMPTEDKSHALFAQAIRSQTQRFKSVVAIVDASSLAGLRKHWNTPLPPEVQNLIEQYITKYEGEEEAQNSQKKRLIADKPVVAVGAGATAVLGASSLSKALPASTMMKLVTYKIPASLKLGLLQTQKAMTIAFSKALGTSKVVASGLASSGSKSTLIMKATTSTNKIRAVSHSIRAYAQCTSFSATRTAFYEIMRKRHFQPIGYMPWIKFGCSVSACAGLLAYGDGIECAVESVPVAPAIASLGRGLQNLHEANQVVRQGNGAKIQEAIQSLMYRFKK